MTAKDETEKVLTALEAYLNGWVKFREFRVQSGWGYASEKRVDLFAMHPHPSKRNERVAFEVKVSRSDFTKELRNPLKRWVGMLFSNRFYFAAPKGLIRPKEVPTECGLIEVEDRGNVRGIVKVKVKAPWRDTPPPTWPFVASLIRRVKD